LFSGSGLAAFRRRLQSEVYTLYMVWCCPLTKRDYKGEKVTVWPEYIDATRPRRLGRKISLREAVKKPSLEEVRRAAEELGLDPIVEEDVKYPRNWMYSKGVVMVSKAKPKTVLLRDIARRIRERRARKG